MRIIVALAAVTTCLSGSALAEDKKPVDPNKKICESERPTGSYFVKRVCHTKAEWDAIAAAERRTTDSMRQSTVGRGAMGPGS